MVLADFDSGMVDPFWLEGDAKSRGFSRVRSNECVSELYEAGLQPLVPYHECKPGASPRAGIRARLQRSALNGDLNVVPTNLSRNSMERAFSPWFLFMDANPGLRPGLV